MVRVMQTECYCLERNCNTSDKEEGSSFYEVAELFSLRGDKDLPLNPGFAETSFVLQSKTLG